MQEKGKQKLHRAQLSFQTSSAASQSYTEHLTCRKSLKKFIVLAVKRRTPRKFIFIKNMLDRLHSPTKVTRQITERTPNVACPIGPAKGLRTRKRESQIALTIHGNWAKKSNFHAAPEPCVKFPISTAVSFHYSPENIYSISARLSVCFVCARLIVSNPYRIHFPAIRRDCDMVSLTQNLARVRCFNDFSKNFAQNDFAAISGAALKSFRSAVTSVGQTLGTPGSKNAAKSFFLQFRATLGKTFFHKKK